MSADGLDYEVGVSADHTYLYVRNVKVAVTMDLVMEVVSRLSELDESSSISRLLLDARGVVSLTRVAERYDFAYRRTPSIGTGPQRVALLHDAGDRSFDFLVTVLGNAGQDCRAFEREGDAVAWLQGRQTGSSEPE